MESAVNFFFQQQPRKNEQDTNTVKLRVLISGAL
jgi:hypothetical protein